MTKVHTQIYMGKTITVFREYAEFLDKFMWTSEIDGKRWHSTSKKRSYDCYYSTEGKAMGGAKSHIKKNMSKEDEIKRIENEIAELQAKLESLKNS